LDDELEALRKETSNEHQRQRDARDRWFSPWYEIFGFGIFAGCAVSIFLYGFSSWSMLGLLLGVPAAWLAYTDHQLDKKHDEEMDEIMRECMFRLELQNRRRLNAQR